VRADREAEVLGLDLLRVAGQDDPAARHRHPLHARQDLHDRILAFSGSKGARAPTTSTVTGKRSSMYSTASASEPSTACSGGKYAIRRYAPSEGPAPALVTYERRPLASVSGVPSRNVIGSRPSGERLAPPRAGGGVALARGGGAARL